MHFAILLTKKSVMFKPISFVGNSYKGRGNNLKTVDVKKPNKFHKYK